MSDSRNKACAEGRLWIEGAGYGGWGLWCGRDPAANPSTHHHPLAPVPPFTPPHPGLLALQMVRYGCTTHHNILAVGRLTCLAMLFLLLILSGLGQLTSAGHRKWENLGHRRAARVGGQSAWVRRVSPSLLQNPDQVRDHPGWCYSPPSFRILWHPKVRGFRGGLGQLFLT